MTPGEQRNLMRERAVEISRACRELFFAPLVPKGWLWRIVFYSDDGVTLRRAGERVLGELARYCLAHKSAFDPDPLVMARRAGRQEVFLRICSYLNLDHDKVQKLMEIDDGY